MNINPDYLIERRRNKNQLIRWKIISLILIVTTLLAVGKKIPHNNLFGSIKENRAKDHIVSVRIEEIIQEDPDIIKKLNDIAEDKKVRAVLLGINSPGGSSVGAEMLYNAVRKISLNKPVVVVLGTVAASGGYMTALGGDYIIAHNSTITGSIGVIVQTTEITNLAEKIGITFNNFKSGNLKASPNPTEKLTSEVKEATMESIGEIYDYFIELVALRRNLDIKYVRQIADGRVYSGRKALALKLIDAVGDRTTALEWLYSAKNISRDLEIIEKKLKPKDNLLDMLIEDFQMKIKSFFYKSLPSAQSLM